MQPSVKKVIRSFECIIWRVVFSSCTKRQNKFVTCHYFLFLSFFFGQKMLSIIGLLVSFVLFVDCQGIDKSFCDPDNLSELYLILLFSISAPYEVFYTNNSSCLEQLNQTINQGIQSDSDLESNFACSPKECLKIINAD
jgi:hypothetical protein